MKKQTTTKTEAKQLIDIILQRFGEASQEYNRVRVNYKYGLYDGVKYNANYFLTNR